MCCSQVELKLTYFTLLVAHTLPIHGTVWRVCVCTSSNLCVLHHHKRLRITNSFPYPLCIRIYPTVLYTECSRYSRFRYWRTSLFAVDTFCHSNTNTESNNDKKILSTCCVNFFHVPTHILCKILCLDTFYQLRTKILFKFITDLKGL